MRKQRDPIEHQIMLAVFSGITNLLAWPLKKLLPGLSKTQRLNRQKVFEQWQRIENLANGSGVHLHQAINEADRLLDYVLKSMAVGGTMGDRLKNVQGKFSHFQAYQDAWEAHKVRNRLAHEIEHGIHDFEAREAIERYRRALRGLGVL